MEYFSAIKRWNNAIFSNRDGLSDYHAQRNKSDRERQISRDVIYMWKVKKSIQMNLFTKHKEIKDFEIKLMVTNLEVSVGRDKLIVSD